MPRELSNDEEWRCRRQGRLFMAAYEMGFDSEDFVEKWMHSTTAASLDDEIGWINGMGDAYILEYFRDTNPGVKRATEFLPEEVMYWIGLVYRRMCLSENISSKEAYAMYNVEDMKQLYIGYHMMGTDLAVEDMVNGYKKRQQKRRKHAQNLA